MHGRVMADSLAAECLSLDSTSRRFVERVETKLSVMEQSVKLLAAEVKPMAALADQLAKLQGWLGPCGRVAKVEERVELMQARADDALWLATRSAEKWENVGDQIATLRRDVHIEKLEKIHQEVSDACKRNDEECAKMRSQFLEQTHRLNKCETLAKAALDRIIGEPDARRWGAEEATAQEDVASEVQLSLDRRPRPKEMLKSKDSRRALIELPEEEESSGLSIDMSSRSRSASSARSGMVLNAASETPAAVWGVDPSRYLRF